MLDETSICHSSLHLNSPGQLLITYGSSKSWKWDKWVLSLSRLAWSIHCRYRLLLSSSCFSRLVTVTRVPLWPPRGNHWLLMAVQRRETGASGSHPSSDWPDPSIALYRHLLSSSLFLDTSICNPRIHLICSGQSLITYGCPKLRN